VSKASDLSTRKILVVDDDPVILKTLFLAFKARGHEVYGAVDGPEAFSIARREKLDLIVLDMFFPPDAAQSGNTWNAFLIIDWFRRIGVAATIPIIIISGAEPAELKDRCLAAGAVAFFSKPLDMPRLLDAVQEIFGRKTGQAGAEPNQAMKTVAS
jgi:CheY-like chemotaxis protein